jgi:glycosyltransferase involved in cell wall biosynthesis
MNVPLDEQSAVAAPEPIESPFIEVHHFGPDIRRVGGIERVVEILVDHDVGADRTVFHPTRARGSAKDFLLSILSVTFGTLRLPSDAIAHVHLSQGGSFIREGSVLVLANMRGHASVATIHGSRFVEFARARPRLVRFILKRASVVTCLSDEALATIHRLAPGARVTLVPNPVPTDRNSQPAGDTDEIVLFAGEISERKGVDVLCQAWPMISARRPAATCLLVGPRTELGVPPLEGMTVAPPVSGGEMGALLHKARVVVLPSRNEGMPMILTEALSAGRPFVSTPVGGIPQLANGTQPLVPVGDAPALAERITQLLEDPALATRIGESGRAFHADTRSTEVVGRTLRAIYTSALQRCSPRARER